MTATACILAAMLVLSSATQIATAVVCIGLDGHIDIEYLLEGCCVSSTSSARIETVALAPASSSCGDCTDVQLKAPPLRFKESQLSQPEFDAGCIACSLCGSNAPMVRTTASADMDQHWHCLAPLSTVVLLT